MRFFNFVGEFLVGLYDALFGKHTVKDPVLTPYVEAFTFTEITTKPGASAIPEDDDVQRHFHRFDACTGKVFRNGTSTEGHPIPPHFEPQVTKLLDKADIAFVSFRDNRSPLGKWAGQMRCLLDVSYDARTLKTQKAAIAKASK